MNPLLTKLNLRRRTEDVDYWRKRAGWFDDDVSMQQYNSGIQDSYYQMDDDVSVKKRSGTSRNGLVGAGSTGLMTFFKIGAAVLAVIFAILLFRALNRRTASNRKVSASSKHSTTESKHRSRSRSRSSRSRSRSRRQASTTHTSSSANYDLMDEKSERSKRSSRSRSRGRRHSKSRKSSRSRSKSRQTKEVLV